MPRLGPKAFEQCAGFLRIPAGDDPLDASAVHPESYPVVHRIIAATKSKIDALIGNATVLRALSPNSFVDDRFGLPTVTDILRELEKPGRDPRPAFKTAEFKAGVETLNDLEPGMVLEGVVTNVAAFGAFVDVGVHQDGLVHVSAMSKSFVKDPRSVVKPGDIVRVKVLEVDKPRKRIALTLRLDDQAGSQPARSARPEGGGASRRDKAAACSPAKPLPRATRWPTPCGGPASARASSALSGRDRNRRLPSSCRTAGVSLRCMISDAGEAKDAPLDPGPRALDSSNGRMTEAERSDFRDAPTSSACRRRNCRG